LFQNYHFNSHSFNTRALLTKKVHYLFYYNSHSTSPLFFLSFNKKKSSPNSRLGWVPLSSFFLSFFISFFLSFFSYPSRHLPTHTCERALKKCVTHTHILILKAYVQYIKMKDTFFNGDSQHVLWESSGFRGWLVGWLCICVSVFGTWVWLLMTYVVYNFVKLFLNVDGCWWVCCLVYMLVTVLMTHVVMFIKKNHLHTRGKVPSGHIIY